MIAKSVEKETEMVIVDFLEIDHIRWSAREWIKEYRKSHPRIADRYGRAVWENSSFYIGRRVRRVTMHRIALPLLAVYALAKYLRGRYPEYHVGSPTVFGSVSVRLA